MKLLHRLVKYSVICSITVLTVVHSSIPDGKVTHHTLYPLIAQSTAIAQVPSLPGSNETQVPPPSNVVRQGTLESTKVYLDGKELFKIASPLVRDRRNPGNQIPVEVRAKQIEANLERIVNSNVSERKELNPNTPQVLIETINGQPVLFVKNAVQSEAEVLLTVTEADAQYASTTKERLANQWKEILEQELQHALELRQPQALRQHIAVAIKVLCITLVLSLGLSGIWMRLNQHRKQIERRKAAETTTLPIAEPIEVGVERNLEETRSETEQARSPLQGLQRYWGLQQRLQTVRFLQWLLFWALIFTWVIGIAYSLNLFPQTQRIAKKIIIIPIVILLTWFVAGLINRLAL